VKDDLSAYPRSVSEACDESMMLGRQNRAVRFLDERQHLHEVVEVVIDGQYRQLATRSFSLREIKCSTFVRKGP
jgi:hypothetical protein